MIALCSNFFSFREALAGLKCRCGTHMGILRAVKRAAAMMS